MWWDADLWFGVYGYLNLCLPNFCKIILEALTLEDGFGCLNTDYGADP